MEWNEETVLDFIELYRSKDILWDTQHPKYYNKVKKSDAWDEIAKDINTTPEECKKKINALLSALRREKAKIKKSQGTGTGRSDVYESSWFAFKSLLFLWDKNKVRNTQNTIDQEPEASNAVPEGTTIDNPATIDTSQEDNEPVRTLMPQNGNQEIVPPPTERHTTRKRKCTTNQKLDEAFEILLNASKTKEANECHTFGTLVARKLQKYSNIAQTAVQEAIMNILFKADRGYYDQRSAHALPPDIRYHLHPMASNSSHYSFTQDTQNMHNLVNQRSHSSQSHTSQYSPVPSPTPSHMSSISDYSTYGSQSQNTQYLLLQTPSPSSHHTITTSCDNAAPPSSAIFTGTLDSNATDGPDFPL